MLSQGGSWTNTGSGFSNGLGSTISYSPTVFGNSLVSDIFKEGYYTFAVGGGSAIGTSVTYDQAIAFLYFGNINFSQFGDDITVNKNGNVSKIIRNNKPNRFFDESGIQLFFNDPESVDKTSQNKKYDIGDQVYYQIDRNEFLDAYNK